MKYLGVDYGKRKIGLSISEGLVATPLKVLEVSSLQDALSQVSSIVKKKGIDELVVGVPESGESKRMAEDFIQRICSIVKVVEFEETLSTQEARQRMIELGKGKKQRSLEDSYSATIILQNYLDSISHYEQ